MKEWKIYNSDSTLHNVVLAETEQLALQDTPAGATATEVVEVVDDSTPPRTWTVYDIRAGMTLTERVSWDNDSHNSVVTAKIELSQPQELTETTAVLDLLVTASVISTATKTSILA